VDLDTRRELADAARDENLRLLGFRDIVFFPGMLNRVQSVATNQLRCYIIGTSFLPIETLLSIAADASPIFDWRLT
jgi:hypothetical protein